MADKSKIIPWLPDDEFLMFIGALRTSIELQGGEIVQAEKRYIQDAYGRVQYCRFIATDAPAAYRDRRPVGKSHAFTVGRKTGESVYRIVRVVSANGILVVDTTYANLVDPGIADPRWMADRTDTGAVMVHEVTK